jgi:ATP-dependent Clp protease protease subunit
MPILNGEANFMILEIEKPSTILDKVYIECLKERKIILNQEIDASIIEYVVSAIRLINLEDDKNNISIDQRKPIEIYVNSPGGSAYDGFSAVNIILSSKTPVYTYCEGYAMSMALAIFAAGHKRFAYRYSTFMYHEVSSGVMGRNIEIERANKENKRMQKMYDSVLLERTNMDQKRLDKVKKDSFDWFFDAEEALGMGLIHEII